VLLLGAKASFANAQSHFRVAESAASIAEYGIGNSLLILSVEECVKSMILTAGFLGIEIPFDVSPFFKDHKTKHGQAAEIQPLLNEVWKLRDVFIDFFKNKRSVFDTVVGLTFTWSFTSIGLKNQPLKDFTESWKQANPQKNNGFYVGYNGSGWQSPATFGKSVLKKLCH
jgi:AbiV family abortive infection protein